jgi:hypothetical protein
MKVVAIILLIVLAGCDFGSGDQTGVFLTASISPFGERSGLVLMDEGLINIPLVIEIENHMRQNATNVRVVPSNLNNRIINTTAIAQGTLEIPGTISLDGTPGYATIQAEVGVARQKREYSTRIDYHLCADTTTHYEGVICVAPLGSTTYYREGCQPVDVRISEGQQSPVAVVAMRQMDAVNSISIMFDLVNYADGIVFEAGTPSCSYIEQEHAGKVTLRSLRIGGQVVDCTSEDPTPTRRMGFDQRYQRYTGVTFQCIVDKNAITGSSTVPVARPISAIFEYAYHTRPAQQTVIIRGIPGYDQSLDVASPGSTAQFCPISLTSMCTP